MDALTQGTGAGEQRGRGAEGQGEKNQCPMPNAQCPMHNAQCPMPKFNVGVPNLLPHPAATKVLLGAELSGMGK
ncbi:hypothetical protein [Nostoc sp.]|uniref:hypothetical protein n=1 Tax=Nostoc sp. TaxID=1180 RepID=UPI002FF82E58